MKHHLCRSWIEKIDGCKTNPENLSSTKVDKDIPSDFSMSTISSFKSMGNKRDLYKSKDCMIWEYLTEHAIEIINSKKKKKNRIICKYKNLLYL